MLLSVVEKALSYAASEVKLDCVHPCILFHLAKCKELSEQTA